MSSQWGELQEKDGRIIPQIVNKYKGIKGFVSFYNWAYKIKYMITDKAKWRAKVVSFFEKYGLKPTEEAFLIKKPLSINGESFFMKIKLD